MKLKAFLKELRLKAQLMDTAFTSLTWDGGVYEVFIVIDIKKFLIDMMAALGPAVLVSRI